VSDYVVQGKLGGDVTVDAATNNWVIPFTADFDPRGWLVNAGSGGSSGGPGGYTTRARVIPTVAGYYEVSIGARWDVGTTANNQINIQITKNATTVMLLQDLIPTNTGGVGNSMGGSKIIYLNGTTDYINATAYTFNSGGQVLKGDADGQNTWFSVSLISYGPGVTGNTGPTGPPAAGGGADITNPGQGRILTATGTSSSVIISQPTLVFTGTGMGVFTSVPRAGLGSTTALDVSGNIYGRLPVTVVSGTTLDISANYAQYANSYIYLTNPAFSTITNPSVTTTTHGGTFFQFKNATPTYLNVTMANTVTITSPVVIPPSNAVTLVVSPTTANTFLLF
jgi:hypothetical protein